jgi:hypothetical protein
VLQSYKHPSYQQAPSYIEDHDKLIKVKEEISSARKDFFKGKRSEILLELNQNQKLQLNLAFATTHKGL